MREGEAARRRGRTWGVILGVSAGTGAAIARAVARDPGLDIHGVHRGKHPAGAAAVEADAAAAGARAVIRTSDAGTAEGALMGAADLLALAGPRSIRFFVHSIANASLGRFTSGGNDPFELARVASYPAAGHWLHRRGWGAERQRLWDHCAALCGLPAALGATP